MLFISRTCAFLDRPSFCCTPKLSGGLHREEISQARLNTVRGIENLDRLDESLYQDFETEDMRKVSHDCQCSVPACGDSLWIQLMCAHAVQKRVAKEAKEHERLRKAAEKVPVLACWGIFSLQHPSPQPVTLTLADDDTSTLHQKGEDPEILAAKKREMEVKRAAAASKGTKTYYKVTVKVEPALQLPQ